MTHDVVVELDRWLDNSNDHTTPIDRIVVQRARDEIVALRRLRDGLVAPALASARTEALEEAAQVCEQYCDSPMIVQIAGKGAAAAIRALKEKRDD